MLSPHEPLQCVFEVPGEAGFAIFGVAVKDDPDRIFEADVLTPKAKELHHGDIVVVTSRPRHDGPDRRGTAAHVAAMVHKDREGRVTLTKLLEVPHDPESLRNLLAGMPAALRQGREGAPTQTQPPRRRVFPERTRIADGPTERIATQAIAQGRDAELAGHRGADAESGSAAPNGRAGTDRESARSTNGRGKRRKAGGMNLR